ncbi:MAG: heavy metal-binding domain-containing protein, partial [Desulfobacteria bacterium]
MSDDKLPEKQEAGMPREIAGSTPAGSPETPPEGTGEAPPEGPGKKKRRWIYYIVAAMVVLAGGVAYLYFSGCLGGVGGTDNTAGAQARGAKYTCGMHPFIILDKPGNCPVCGMKLTKLESSPVPGGATASSSATAAKPSGGARKILFYRNAMNPNVTSPTPSKDSMGMDFVPVYEDEARGSGGGAALPEGYA